MRQLRLSLTFAGLALSTALGFVGVSVSSKSASAVVYCQYAEYPVGCVARAGVVLRPRPVARAAAGEAVRPGTPKNRGGPVNRVGRRLASATGARPARRPSHYGNVEAPPPLCNSISRARTTGNGVTLQRNYV